MNTVSPTALPAVEKTESLLTYAMLSVIATAGFFYVNIMAAIVDGLVTGWGFTNAQAGFVGAANIYGASVGSLIAVFIVRRVPWRPTLIALFVLLIIVDLASTSMRIPTALIAMRALHGVIGGMSVGITYSLMARTGAPDRAFGMLLLVQYTLGGLGVMELPPLVPEHGAGVLFLALAALTCVALLCALLLRNPGAASNTLRRAVGASFPLATVALTLLALFLFQAGNMALAAFIIRLGEGAGLLREFVSNALGWATWLGSAGAVAVIVLGTRHGRVLPLLAGLILALACSAAFYWSRYDIVYFAANLGSAIAWSFSVPYLFGMAAQMDGSGQLTTIAGLVSKLGLASGPLVAGLIVVGNDFNPLIAVALCALVLCCAVALPAARRLESNR